MYQLLSGLKVIDLTTIVLGPYATQILADFGAQVIKVEALAGDLFRAVRPGRRPDIGVQFQNFNRNKRSLVLDLKATQSRQLLYQLVADADVVVHNMRSRSAAALGVSYQDLRAHNKKLIYCYAPGFADGGPSQDDPAYDDIIQARSGLAALNADASGAPQFVRSIICDKVVGLHLAIAILAGVASRDRSDRGVCIEAPMLETMTAFLLSEHLAGHSLVPPEGELGYARMLSPHRQPYRTKDSYLAILPYSTRHWTRFFTLCNKPELAADPKVTNPELRSEHIDELYQQIALLAPQHSNAQWIELLRQQDIPCAPVNQLEDLFRDPQLQASGAFALLQDPELGQLMQLRTPFRIHDDQQGEAQPDRRAPGLGEDTRAVLRELDLSEDQIQSLYELGIVA